MTEVGCYDKMGELGRYLLKTDSTSSLSLLYDSFEIKLSDLVLTAMIIINESVKW